MKPTVIVTMASAASAGLVVPRDASAALAAISQVSKDVEALNSAISNYKGEDKETIFRLVDTLNRDLQEGKLSIEQAGSLSLKDGMSLRPAVVDLGKKAEGLTVSLIEKKAEVERSSACFDVQDSLETISTNSREMIKTAIDKLPGIAKGVAKGFASPIEKSMIKAKKAYSSCAETSGVPASGSGGSGAPKKEEGSGGSGAPKKEEGSSGSAKVKPPAILKVDPDYVPSETKTTATSTTAKSTSTAAQSTSTTAKPTSTTATSKTKTYASSTDCTSDVPGTAYPTGKPKPQPIVNPAVAGAGLNVPAGALAAAVAAFAM